MFSCCLFAGMFAWQVIEHNAQKSDKHGAMQYAWIGMPIVSF